MPNGMMLTVMPTFRCGAECEHCGSASSPRDDTWLPLEHVLKLIDEAADSGYSAIVFSGGEATMAPDVLKAGLNAAAARRLPVRLVTNAQWATEDSTAEALLYDWMFAGLTELNISTGDQHARFVPLDNVIRAARTAAAIGMPAVITVEVREGNRLMPDEVRARLSDAAVEVIPWVWTDLTPMSHTRQPGAANRSNLHDHGGCEEMFSNMTVQANGAITPCCGLGIRYVRDLHVGRAGIDTLREARDRAMANPLMRAIRETGPARLIAAAAERDPRIQWEDVYTHRCHACIRLHKDPAVRDPVEQMVRTRREG